MYIYRVVKGEEAAEDLLHRMRKLKPDEHLMWCESFARAANVLVERVWEMAPEDDCYKEYVIMYMEHPSGKSGSISRVREWAYEDIRTGKVSC